MELLSFVISRLCCSLEVLRTPHSSNCLTGRRQEPGQSPITCQLAANQACRLLSSHHVNTVAIFLGLSDWLSQGKMLVWIIYPAQPGGLASGTTRGSDHWGSVAELSDYSRTISKQWVLDWGGQGTHLLQGRSLLFTSQLWLDRRDESRFYYKINFIRDVRWPPSVIELSGHFTMNFTCCVK